MIKLGLTTWSEHRTLVQVKKTTLVDYSSKLPLVEIDSSFYGIPRVATVESWVKETPENFKFLIKAHKTMTQHSPWQDEFSSEEVLYQNYLKAIAPIVNSHKLEAILFQFPPYFSCTIENIVYLRRLRKIFNQLPIAIEFRNGTWFDENHIEGMSTFMKEQNYILTIVDEPQVPLNTVPFVPVITNPKQTLIRLHGRNIEGWLSKGENWRKERTLYRYNQAELNQLAVTIRELETQVEEVAIIFNNNSGGDAADNALQLQKILNIHYTGLHPEQIDLF